LKICSKCKTDISMGLTRQLDKGKYKRLKLCNKCYLVLSGLPVMPPRDAVVHDGGFKPIVRGNLYVE